LLRAQDPAPTLPQVLLRFQQQEPLQVLQLCQVLMLP
jgi:hypothetical protein